MNWGTTPKHPALPGHHYNTKTPSPSWPSLQNQNTQPFLAIITTPKHPALPGHHYNTKMPSPSRPSFLEHQKNKQRKAITWSRSILIVSSAFISCSSTLSLSVDTCSTWLDLRVFSRDSWSRCLLRSAISSVNNLFSLCLSTKIELCSYTLHITYYYYRCTTSQIAIVTLIKVGEMYFKPKTEVASLFTLLHE